MNEKKNAEAMNEETNLLDLLLSAKSPVLEKQIEMKRMSEELGQPVVFTIKALSYNTLNEFITNKPDPDLRTVLEGLAAPDLKDASLLAKYEAATPMELLKDLRFIRPGEITYLAIEIQKLSGYSKDIFGDVVKN